MHPRSGHQFVEPYGFRNERMPRAAVFGRDAGAGRIRGRNDLPRWEKSGDPVAAACEGAVEDTRQDSGAGESEEDGSPAVPPRAAQDLGERFFTGENRPARQNEVHRLEAYGLGNRGESRTGLRGAAREIFEGVGVQGVAADPVGGRAAHRAIRIVDENSGHQQIRGS